MFLEASSDLAHRHRSRNRSGTSREEPHRDTIQTDSFLCGIPCNRSSLGASSDRQLGRKIQEAGGGALNMVLAGTPTPRIPQFQRTRVDSTRNNGTSNLQVPATVCTAGTLKHSDHETFKPMISGMRRITLETAWLCWYHICNGRRSDVTIFTR